MLVTSGLLCRHPQAWETHLRRMQAKSAFWKSPKMQKVAPHLFHYPLINLAQPPEMSQSSHSQPKACFSWKPPVGTVLGSSLFPILLCSVAWGCSLPLWASGGRGAPPCSARRPRSWGQGRREALSPECGKIPRTSAHNRAKPPWDNLPCDQVDDSSDPELCFLSRLTSPLGGIYSVENGES